MEDFYLDSAVSKAIDEQGYTTVDLLTPQETDALIAIYKSFHLTSPQGGVLFSHLDAPQARLNDIPKEVCQILRPKLSVHFKNFRTTVCGFAIKAASDPGSAMPAHQDWSFVDETRAHTLNCWIPLTDTTLENGALRVLPRSHKMFSSIRGSPPQVFMSPLTPHLDLINTRMQLIPMRAGQALFYDHRLIHDSLPNTSSSPRITAICSVYRSFDQLLHHYVVPGSGTSRINRYAVADTFFQRETTRTLTNLYAQGQTITETDDCQLLETIDYHPASLERQKFLALLGEPPERSSKLSSYEPFKGMVRKYSQLKRFFGKTGANASQ